MDNWKDFEAVGMVADGEIPVDVIDFNGAMAVCTPDMPIIITKEQAMKFFDLVEPAPNSSRHAMHEVQYEVYKCERGYTLKREQGKTPNGNEMNNRWVLRDDKSEFVDFDAYRSDIAERNHLNLHSA